MPRKPEIIIALDLGTRCGWAVFNGKRVVESGRWSLLTSRKGRHRAERWLNFDARLETLIEHYEPDVVAYEEVRRHVGTTAAHVYGGLLAQVEIADWRWPDAEFVPIGVGTWKKATVGQGNATKDDVLHWAKRKFRFTPKSEDEADALGIGEAVRRIRRGEYAP